MGIQLGRRTRRLSAGKVSSSRDRRVVHRRAKSSEQSTAKRHADLEMKRLRLRTSGRGGAATPYEVFDADERVTCRAHRSVGRRIGHTRQCGTAHVTLTSPAPRKIQSKYRQIRFARRQRYSAERIGQQPRFSGRARQAAARARGQTKRAVKKAPRKRGFFASWFSQLLPGADAGGRFDRLAAGLTASWEVLVRDCTSPLCTFVWVIDLENVPPSWAWPLACAFRLPLLPPFDTLLLTF